MYDIGCGDGRVLIEMASRSIPFTNEEYDSTRRCEDDQTKNNTEVTSSMQQSTTSSVVEAATTTSQQHYCTKFIGLDISPERVTEARNNIQKARTSAHIPPHVSIKIICGNALDTDNDAINYTDATVIFLYLVPRGLRLIKPLVWPKDDEEEGGRVDEDKRRVNNDDTEGDLAAAKNEEEGGQTDDPQLLATTTQQQQQVHKNNSSKRRRRTIITYMSPFEDETYVRKELCRVEHQDGAAWPVYLYHTSCEAKR